MYVISVDHEPSCIDRGCIGGCLSRAVFTECHTKRHFRIMLFLAITVKRKATILRRSLDLVFHSVVLGPIYLGCTTSWPLPGTSVCDSSSCLLDALSPRKGNNQSSAGPQRRRSKRQSGGNWQHLLVYHTGFLLLSL